MTATRHNDKTFQSYHDEQNKFKSSSKFVRIKLKKGQDEKKNVQKYTLSSETFMLLSLVQLTLVSCM